MVATVYEKLMLLPNALAILGSVLYAAIMGPFRGIDGAPTWQEHVSNTFNREMISKFTVGQLQWMIPAFQQTYEKWCKTNNVKPQITQIPGTNIQGYWMGNRETAKYIMMFIHGGGFVIPGNYSHIDFCDRVMKWSKGQIAVFCPDYSLAPAKHYPTQIGECVEALRYVLSLPDVNPSKVMLGADSVGGMVALALLSHVSGHPHPNSKIVKPLSIESPLRAAVLMSAWVSADEDKFSSFARLEHRDIDSFAFTHRWMSAYKGFQSAKITTERDDEYVAPEMADPKWWGSLKVKEILSTVGQDEALIDPTKSWAQKVQKGLQDAGRDKDVKFKVVIGEREIHIASLTAKSTETLDALGDRCQEGAVRNWVRNLS